MESAKASVAAKAVTEGAAPAPAKKKPGAKSTAVTHRHKKQETAEAIEVMAPAASLAETPAEPVAAAVMPAASPRRPTQEEIARRAYSYYVARGYQPGDPAYDWFRAEQELLAEFEERS